MSEQVSIYLTNLSRQKRTHEKTDDDGCNIAKKKNGYEKKSGKENDKTKVAGL